MTRLRAELPVKGFVLGRWMPLVALVLTAPVVVLVMTVGNECRRSKRSCEAALPPTCDDQHLRCGEGFEQCVASGLEFRAVSVLGLLGLAGAVASSVRGVPVWLTRTQLVVRGRRIPLGEVRSLHLQPFSKLVVTRTRGELEVPCHAPWLGRLGDELRKAQAAPEG